MVTKTKDFQLNEENTFKNEIIHFFNINANNSIIYIYLEIEGKRMKSEKPENNKILLKELVELKNTKKEIKCLLNEDAELKILIRIIRKYTKYFKKKSKSFYKKSENEKTNNSKKNLSPATKKLNPGMSIKDKIKLFSGEFVKKQIINNKIIPGRLIMPKIFQNDVKNNKNEDEKNKGNKNKLDKKEDKKV